MKVVIVGGGSTYTPEIVEGLAFWNLTGGVQRVTLHDIDPRRLELVGSFCKRLAQGLNSDLEVELEDNLHKALEHADFVLLTVRVGGLRERMADIQMAAQAGVPAMESAGAAAIAGTVRTVPEVLRIARIVREKAPQAWVLNLTNPVGIVTEAVARFATIRSLGISHIPREFHMNVAQHLRVDPKWLELDWIGLNHLSWVRRILVQGQNRLPALIDSVGRSYRQGASPPELDFPAEMLKRLGMIPTPQLRPYYFGGSSRRQETGLAQNFDAMKELERKLLEQYADPELTMKPTLLWERGGTWASVTSVEVMKALSGGNSATHVVNTLNMGVLEGFPGDAAIEVPCTISREGVTPRRLGEPEESILGLMRHVKSSERLALEAAVTGNESSLYLALLNHPLVPSEREAGELFKALRRRGYG